MIISMTNPGFLTAADVRFMVVTLVLTDTRWGAA